MEELCNMININQFAEEIATLFNRQFDIPFIEVLKSSIVGYKATILKQEFDKNGRFPRGSEYNLCLPLVRVKPTECCASEDLDCYIARTVNEVPSAVRTNTFTDPFLFVGTSNMEKAFSYARADSVKYIIDSNKFSNDNMYYDYFNRYIYTFNYEGGKIGVRDVFSNPLELMLLKGCEGKPCIDAVYIEDDMKRLIKQFILEEYKSLKVVPEEQQIKINEQQ